MTALTVRLDDVIYEALREEAFRTRVPMSRLVATALILLLNIPEPAAGTVKACAATTSDGTSSSAT